MADPTGSYIYEEITRPLGTSLQGVVRQTVAAWHSDLEEAVAAMVVTALTTNDVLGTTHLILDRAEVTIWLAKTIEYRQYVVLVEGEGHIRHYTFLPDVEMTTLEALVKRLFPREED